MTESELWQVYASAAARWTDRRSLENEAAMVAAYEAWVHAFLDDPVAAHESVEELRRNLMATTRPRAPGAGERMVPRWA